MRWKTLVFVLVVVCVLIMVFVVSETRKTPPPLLDRIYYINLDRRQDRKRHFLRQCQKEGIDMRLVQRFSAMDGKTLVLSPQEETMFEHANYRHAPYAKNVMANQLSHYRILQDMHQNGYGLALVFQDDVVLKEGFWGHLQEVVDHLPEDAEMVNLGFHKTAVLDHFEPLDLQDGEKSKTSCRRTVNRAICKVHDHVNPCSLAYLVTRKGCANLLAYFQTHGFRSETDWNYNHYLQGKDIHYASTTALCTGALMGSDIFTRKKLILPYDRNGPLSDHLQYCLAGDLQEFE
jgi:GR25 family glycosyltransferase involved in LPS biosynthesis